MLSIHTVSKGDVSMVPRARLLRFVALGLMAAALALSGCQKPLQRVPLATPAFDAATLQKLQSAVLENPEALLAARGLQADPGATWHTDNPYQPTTPLGEAECLQSANCMYARQHYPSQPAAFPAQPSVYDWWSTRQTDPSSAQVCGARFTDAARTRYELQTFNSLIELQATPGVYLTHYHACGTCSTLQDLAVYGSLDLTVMGKTCSKRLTPAAKKACMQEIGFTEACAETWAYNAGKTAQACALTCVRTYGLLNVIRGTESVPTTDANGNLNACLQCDETMAGPGFQYAAGRTRRDSGIISEIARPDEQVYSVPHDYFR